MFVCLISPNHIHTDLKWSSQPKSGLEMSRLTPEWPRQSLRDQFGKLGAPKDCEDRFRSVWICTCLFQNPVLFCKYLSSLKLHKIGSVFKIYIWILVYKWKKWFRNLLIGFGDIKQTNICFETPSILGS